jgi:hypothetical protein
MSISHAKELEKQYPEFVKQLEDEINLIDTGVWDCIERRFVEKPSKMLEFFEEIDLVCKLYNLSISHEDGHGAFVIEEYDEFNIRWLKNANKRFK